MAASSIGVEESDNGLTKVTTFLTLGKERGTRE